MHAFLIIGNITTSLEAKIDEITKTQKSKAIPFVLEKIEDVRNLKKLVKFSFTEPQSIVINDIDKITQESSNAFLKNLEEPAKNITYILTASNINNVLPTIISRCQVVYTEKTNYETSVKSVNYKDALNIKDRDEAISFINNLILYDHQNNNFKNEENYLDTLANLKANGNVSLQLANFVVRMNGHGR